MPPQRPNQSRQRQDPHLNQAHAAFRAGNLPQAAALYRAILQRRPKLAEAHHALALTLFNQGAIPEALHHAHKAAESEPTNAIYHYVLGILLRDTGNPQAALEPFEKAAWISPSLSDCQADLAALLERFGRFEDAQQVLDRALKANPNHQRSKVLKSLVALRAGTLEESELDQHTQSLQAIADNPDNPPTRCLVWSTLADIHDKRADAPRAFHAFTQCNDAERAIQNKPLDRERELFLTLISDLARSITPETAARWKQEKPDDNLRAPTLLVGFPRSGTTMTERALDAHPGVHSLEEQPTFKDMRAEIIRALPPETTPHTIGQAFDSLTTEHLARLRQIYWERVKQLTDANPADTIILDKLPIRIVELPLVNRLFPEARVIVALRDPRDVCLSCFRQQFSYNTTMSFFLDLQDTAHLYAHVMQAWLDTRDAYSFDCMEIRYEDTVADFEPRIRAMLEFLGLEWNDAVLSFHERTDRVHNTPSYHAVREKVSTKAVARWKRYEDQLAPILPTLKPFITAFGYEQ